MIERVILSKGWLTLKCLDKSLGQVGQSEPELVKHCDRGECNRWGQSLLRNERVVLKMESEQLLDHIAIPWGDRHASPDYRRPERRGSLTRNDTTVTNTGVISHKALKATSIW